MVTIRAQQLDPEFPKHGAAAEVVRDIINQQYMSRFVMISYTLCMILK
jgi:hypothetical protein